MTQTQLESWWKLDDKEESSPLTHLTFPKYPFLSRLWVNEKTLTWRARRVETNEARPMAGSLLLFLYYCLKPQLASLQNAQGSLLWGWDHFIFWLAGHVTISNHSCAFLLKPNLTFSLVESPTLHTPNFLIPEGRPKWEDPGQAHWMLCYLWSLTKSSRESAARSSTAKDAAPLDPKTNKPGRLWTCWRSLWIYKV